MPNEHAANVRWSRGGAAFTDGRYSRGHVWTFDGGVAVPASASPHVVPTPMSVEAAVDPEEAFVAALSSCHMLWFLSLAATRGWLVESYEDDARGTLAPRADGTLAITEVQLRPRVVFGCETPSASEQMALHEAAHRRCFLANSVNTELRITPEFSV